MQIDIKNRLQKFWETNEIYKWDKNEGNNFVIDTPPPTVSGTLHMGHIFSYTHTDIIARYQRMCGKNVFYPIGFDDNGLPTERLVEKQKKIKANQFSREEFRQICREVIKTEELKFKDLMQTMGYSFDWSQSYTTISPHVMKLSQMSFLDLYAKNQVYRKNQPIFWDPVDQTVLAQSELDDHDKDSFMHEMSFAIDGGGHIYIATTRPELLAACVAVFVHPSDERYKSFVGKYAITPLFETKVKIIADENVLQEKGTGAVMCCTFGDTTDVLWWKKYGLATRIILDKRGRMDDIEFDKSSSQNPNKANSYYEQIKGLKVVEAREKIIEILKEVVEVKSAPITHTVKCAERSKAPIELLMMPQWFIKTIEHKDKMLELSKKLQWRPAFMQNRLENWINAVSADWCISRQRFFGVPFPVWYSKRDGEVGKVILPDIKDLPLDPMEVLPRGYSADEVVAEVDIMDTWATSCICPQINSHGIADQYMIDKKRHKNLFPADLRPQGHDIIRTWAFGTILKSYLHEEKLPWSNIMISGWCLAEDKTKMSKSKGNIIDPLNIIKQHDVDAVRYWAASGSLGYDTSYNQEVCLQGKKLITKLKNAAKFCMLHIDKRESITSTLEEEIEAKKIWATSDLWLIALLNQVIQRASNSLNEYDYARAKDVIEKFFWSEFCDTYLEVVKRRVYNDEDKPGQLSAVLTLHHAFKNLLALFAPFIPYATEEIYLDILRLEGSIHQKGSWPKFKFSLEEYIEYTDLILPLLEEVRKAKSQRQLAMNAPVKLLQIRSKQNKLPQDLVQDLLNVTASEKIELVNSLEKLVEFNVIF